MVLNTKTGILSVWWENSNDIILSLEYRKSCDDFDGSA